MAPGPNAGTYVGSETDPLLRPPNLGGETYPENASRTGQKRSQGPDGLLSWIVAFANFLINFIIVGLGRMSGILYVVFMRMFNADRRTASIPFSVQQATRNLFGPLAGILGQKYGVRSVTIVGGFIGAISAAVCYYATDLNWITLMWGLVFGICTALTTTLNQVPIDQYFEKYRTSAGGFAFSGGCVGAFIFPVILELLIAGCGMGGTFLVMGGIILFVVPCALVLKEPPWKRRNEGSLQDGEEEESRPSTAEEEKIGYNTFRPKTSKASSANTNEVEKAVNFGYLRQNSEIVYQLLASTISPETLLQDSLLETEWSKAETEPIVNELEDLCKFLRPPGIDRSSDTGTIMDELTRSVHIVEVKCQTNNGRSAETPKNPNEKEAASNSQSFERYEDNPRWLFIAMKLHEICERSQIDILQYFPINIHVTVAKVFGLLNELNDFVMRCEDLSTSSATDSLNQINNNEISENLPNSKKNERNQNRSNSLIVHIQTAIKLHRNPLFLLICVCRGVFMLTFIPMVTIIVDFAVDKGLKHDTGKYVISCLSLGDLLGRLCLGWITDSGILSLPRYMMFVMMILGISTSTLPFMHSEISLMPAILVFGMLQGSLFIRHQILVSKYMRSHEQAIGMGFINLLSGFLGFALPFYIGE